LSKPVSSRTRRTYFAHPLVEESLKFLPAALEYPTTVAFREYLVEHLHHNSFNTRYRFAKYIAHRFSKDGDMNLDLARAIAYFGDSRSSREIIYFEMLLAVPLLQEIAALWLAEIPEQGVRRSELLVFLETRLGGRSTKEISGSAIQTFRSCGKLKIPKPAVYIPLWAAPPLGAFLYALARLYPEPAMVRVDFFSGQQILRALLWPGPSIEELLKEAARAGHISKISQLDQYHQFTLAGTGEDRLNLLFKPLDGEKGAQ
jgi:hypothetical protein